MSARERPRAGERERETVRERPRAGERDCEGETESGRERETVRERPRAGERERDTGAREQGVLRVLQHRLFFSVGNCKLL